MSEWQWQLQETAIPWKANDAEFEKLLATLSQWISNDADGYIRAARAECALSGELSTSGNDKWYAQNRAQVRRVIGRTNFH